MYSNSYIFLENEKQKIMRNNCAKEQKIIVPTPFHELLKNVFDNIIINAEESSGIINIRNKKSIIPVEFNFYKVSKNYYLNVFINDQRKNVAISTLELLNDTFTKKNNCITKMFLPIITYDSVSKDYCDKLYPLLNEFERKLRRLLYNVYTLNFNLKYYENLNLNNTSREIKAKIPANKLKNVSKEENYAISWFYSVDYGNIEHLLFDKYVSQGDYEKAEQILKKEQDLSTMNDTQLRKIYKSLLPKNDWERFFSNKRLGQKFQQLFKDIHNDRNIIAHCKLIEKEQFNICKNNLKESILLLDNAIKITENYDIKIMNMLTRNETFTRIAQMIGEYYKQLTENLETFIQPLLKMQDQLNKNLKPYYQSLGEKLSDYYSTLDKDYKE